MGQKCACVIVMILTKNANKKSTKFVINFVDFIICVKNMLRLFKLRLIYLQLRMEVVP